MWLWQVYKSNCDVYISCRQQQLLWLTHLGRVTHICAGNLTTIGSDNGLSPGRRQAIIWTSAGILLIWPLGTNFSEIQIGIQTFSYKKMQLQMSSVKWRSFCLGLNVLIVPFMSCHANIYGAHGVCRTCKCLWQAVIGTGWHTKPELVPAERQQIHTQKA